MSYDNLSSVSQNVLKFYQQLTGIVLLISFAPIVLVSAVNNLFIRLLREALLQS
jgi:hypothetical protein